MARLRLEFNVHNGHHKLTADETWVGNLTAAGLFQCLIISIVNGMARLRLEFNIHNGHHKLTFDSWVG
eukprot:scaffold241044_cov50-Cyclotella_meneghiniana.AAC.1